MSTTYGAIQLTKSQYKVLNYLERGARRRGFCHPSVARIARALDLCVRTIRSAIKRLVQLGLIVINSRRSEHGRQAPNLYQMPAIPECNFAPRVSKTLSCSLRRRERALETPETETKRDTLASFVTSASVSLVEKIAKLSVRKMPEPQESPTMDDDERARRFALCDKLRRELRHSPLPGESHHVGSPEVRSSLATGSASTGAHLDLDDAPVERRGYGATDHHLDEPLSGERQGDAIAEGDRASSRAGISARFDELRRELEVDRLGPILRAFKRSERS